MGFTDLKSVRSTLISDLKIEQAHQRLESLTPLHGEMNVSSECGVCIVKSRGTLQIVKVIREA